MRGSDRYRAGLVKVRLAPGPNLVDVSNLNVFICYQTEQWTRANALASRITHMGFRVTIFPPQETRIYESDDVVRKRLHAALEEADILAVVASSAAIQSQWVQFEVGVAAEMIGRVMFFSDGVVAGPPNAFFSQVQPNLTTKHSTIMWDSSDQDLQSRLATTLLYDHDEWWFVRDSALDPLLPTRLDLKRESQMRKVARACVILDGTYRSKNIADVLPFSWSEVGARPGDTDAVLRWLFRGRGRLALEEAFINEELDVGFTGYLVPGAPFIRPGDSEWLELVIATRGA